VENNGNAVLNGNAIEREAQIIATARTDNGRGTVEESVRFLLQKQAKS
jgi:predicted RNA binding protein with dsRBD fold (UPF0201 family)